MMSEVQFDERSIMLDGTDSSFSNEGSALLLMQQMQMELNAGENFYLK